MVFGVTFRTGFLGKWWGSVSNQKLFLIMRSRARFGKFSVGKVGSGGRSGMERRGGVGWERDGNSWEVSEFEELYQL